MDVNYFKTASTVFWEERGLGCTGTSGFPLEEAMEHAGDFMEVELHQKPPWPPNEGPLRKKLRGRVDSMKTEPKGILPWSPGGSHKPLLFARGRGDCSCSNRSVYKTIVPFRSVMMWFCGGHQVQVLLRP